MKVTPELVKLFDAALKEWGACEPIDLSKPFDYRFISRFHVCHCCLSSPLRVVADADGDLHQCFACGAEWFGAPR